jgi:FkbM family methyltransferase
LDDIQGVRLIIDCGAYVGYSSAYFLSRHPGSFLIAIEPDLENVAILKKNLAPYGNRAKLVHAGVWSNPTQLAISKTPFRDGREWAHQFSPSPEASLRGIDIGTLLRSSGEDRISILKMDVEGAEVPIFSHRYMDWLTKVDAIAIELHDDSSFGHASEAFLPLRAENLASREVES